MNLNELLKIMVEKGASDLHLMVGSRPAYRINGDLVPQVDFPILTPDNTASALKQMTDEEQQVAFQNEHELDFAYSVSGLARFRVSVLQQRGSISIAIRLVPYKIPTIEELGLPRICKDLILKPRGLILLTGAAGSGKSTTLAAMLNYLNETLPRNVITIEDPIEYIFQNKKCLIRQRDMGDDTKSFNTALLHALRHDPDVIVIGEMRDLATISTAIRAAETGHLIIGTLHTNDAPQSLDRIIDIFPHGQQRQVRLQLSMVLEGVLSQRLVPRIGGGRIAAFEIMTNNKIIMKYIREERIHEINDFMEHGFSEGMQTMDRALANLVMDGTISLEDALMKCTQTQSIKKIIADKKEKIVIKSEPENAKW
jgi:twitching motility protein PilT